jgi:hypothetical protein
MRRVIIIITLAVLIIYGMTLSYAQEKTANPLYQPEDSGVVQGAVSGEYKINNEDLMGALRVKQIQNNKIQFRIYANSKPNSYAADIEGISTIENNIAIFYGEQNCRLEIKFVGDSAIVSGGNTTCRYYMGAGGGIDGVYFKKLSTNTDWRVSFAGIGPFRIGMSIADAENALGSKLVLSEDSKGCFYGYAKKGPDGLKFLVFENRVARVDIVSGDLLTSTGIKIGDTEQKIKKLYPRVQVSSHHYVEGGHYLTVYSNDNKYALVFETNGSVVNNYRAGKLPEVQWIEGCL